MLRARLGVVCCTAVFGYASAAQNGEVEVNEGRWVVTVRVDQDRSGRVESGVAPRIATTIAARKILEFGCKLKRGPGERIRGQLKGLVTLGSKETGEWAEVVVAAPVQSLKCKLEKLASTAEATVAEPEPTAAIPEPGMLREGKTDY